MAKEITIQSPDGAETYYPKTVSDLVYDNETGKTIKEILTDSERSIGKINEINIIDCLLHNHVFKTQQLINFEPQALNKYNGFIGRVSNGDKFKFTDVRIGGSILIYAVYGEDGIIRKTSSTNPVNEEVEIEEDGYLIVNSNYSNGNIKPVILKNPKKFFSIMQESSIIPNLSSKINGIYSSIDEISTDYNAYKKDNDLDKLATENYFKVKDNNLTYEDFKVGYFDTSNIGTVIDLDKANTESDYRKHYFMKVNQSDVIVIKSVLGGLKGRPYAFLNKDMEIVSNTDINNITNVQLEIPADASYVLLQTSSSDYCDIRINEDITKQNFDKLYSDKKKEIKLLCFGNSFTQDSLSYVPYLLNKYCPDIKFKIGMAVIGGCSLAQHSANFTGLNEQLDGNVVEPKNYSFALSSNDSLQWRVWNNYDVDKLLSFADWGMITFQQNGNNAYTDFDTYFKPYLTKIQKKLFSKVNKPVKMGWILTHGSYTSDIATQLERWQGTVENTKKVLDSTVADFIFTYGTAIQNLRTTSLNTVADYNGFLADEIHLQEGIATLTASYTLFLQILDLIGEHSISIIGDKTLITDELIEEVNVQGTNLGSKGIVGVSEDNCFIAQLAAILAVKKPFEVSEIEA